MASHSASSSSCASLSPPDLWIMGKKFVTGTYINSHIRNQFNNIFYPFIYNPNNVSQHFSKQEKNKIRTTYPKLPIPPKAKEIHYKILSGLYPSSDFIHTRFGYDKDFCCFCNVDTESTDHLFFECIYSLTFWEDVHFWLISKVPLFTDFTKKNIIFGIIRKEKKYDLLLNVIIILGKCFIQKCKFIKCKPYVMFSTKIFNCISPQSTLWRARTL